MSITTYFYPITFLLVCFTLVANAQPKNLSQYPNEFTRDGHVIVLPDHGTVYIVADLHAHWEDFNQWLEQTKLIDKIKTGEDVYGIMLGDAIDYKPDEKPEPPYGDIQIVDRVMELQQQLGENGKRLIYIRGNHEFAAADTYAVMKRRGMSDDNRKIFIDRLYNSINGSYYKQFNFIERMTDKHFDFIMNLPTVVIGKNGFVAVHAGPARDINSISDLVIPDKDTLDEMLWDRSKLVMFGGYTLKHTEDFLNILNANILVVGHTPVGLFSPKYMKDGVVRLGDKQLIFSTGYSGTEGGQTYIEIDLAKTYSSVDELTFGVNIHLLYPK